MDTYSVLAGKEFDEAVLSMTNVVNGILNLSGSTRTTLEATRPLKLFERRGLKELPPTFDIEGILVTMTREGDAALLSENDGKLAIIRILHRPGPTQVQTCTVEEYVSWLTSDARVTKRQARKTIDDALRKLGRHLPNDHYLRQDSLTWHSHAH